MGSLPAVGTLRNGGYVNGLLVFTQPGGPGTKVSPQPSQVNPPPNWKNSNWLPAFPYSYQGLLSWPCGHWTNTAEIYQQYDEENEVEAALLCCPVCSFIVNIVEPYSELAQTYFSLYPTGIRQPGGGPIPAET